MAADQQFAIQLGRAWAQHRENNHAAAIAEFKTILGQSSENIDALYGLGLALRAHGQRADAISTFQSAFALVMLALQENPGEDRYEMLQRMIAQRLNELDAGVMPQ